MSMFGHAEEAPRFNNKPASAISLILAGIFIVMAVGQLFTFEDFPATLSGYWLLGSQANASLLAAFLVTAEVFTLPFLLRMRVSPLMRLLSLACAWFVAITWLILGAWVVITPNALSNAGVLGATVSLTPGLWQLLFSIALMWLVGYITWTQRLTLVLKQKQ